MLILSGALRSIYFWHDKNGVWCVLSNQMITFLRYLSLSHWIDRCFSILIVWIWQLFAFHTFHHTIVSLFPLRMKLLIADYFQPFFIFRFILGHFISFLDQFIENGIKSHNFMYSHWSSFITNIVTYNSNPFRK